MTDILDIARRLTNKMIKAMNLHDTKERMEEFVDLFKLAQLHLKELFECKSGFALKEALLDKCRELAQKGYPVLSETCYALEAAIRALPPPHWSKLPESIEVTFGLPGGRKTFGLKGETLTLLPATRQVVWTRPAETRQFHVNHFYNHYLHHYMSPLDAAVYRKRTLDDMTEDFWLKDMSMTVRTWIETQQVKAYEEARMRYCKEAPPSTTSTTIPPTVDASPDSSDSSDSDASSDDSDNESADSSDDSDNEESCTQGFCGCGRVAPETAEETLLRGFKDLPEQFEVAYRRGDHPPWVVMLLPHYAPTCESPTWRSMVLRKGRLISLFVLRASYMSEYGLPLEPFPTPLTTFLQDLYMINRDWSCSDTTLVEVLTHWTPEQRNQIGTFYQRPIDALTERELEVVHEAQYKNRYLKLGFPEFYDDSHKIMQDALVAYRASLVPEEDYSDMPALIPLEKGAWCC